MSDTKRRNGSSSGEHARPLPRLLVVDGERWVRQAVQRAFETIGTYVVAAETAADALSRLSAVQPDVVLLDVSLPDSHGLELLRKIRQFDGKLPVIFMTADADSDMAIEATLSGAYDYVLKPLDLPALKELVKRAAAMRQMMRVPVRIPNDRSAESNGDVLVGRSDPMLAVYKAVGRVAPESVTVLICGESGTGKELIARAIYQHSPRAERPFLAVNCAALPDALLESELFGHEKGAFTGADRQRIGKFEQCHSGTIFLDEVGDMSPLVQSKILRLLQEQCFERVGGNETIETDVRVIAATNRDLEQMVETGDFRSDLYYRLNGFTLRLPPLRERGNDILLLLEHFLSSFAGQMERQSVDGISAQAVALLQRYPWPGNVRELQSVVKQALLNAGGSVILPEVLPTKIRNESPATIPLTPAEEDRIDCDLHGLIDRGLHEETGTLYADTLASMECHLLTRVMQRTNGNQSHAARLLGITRGSLRNKLRQQQISMKRIVGTGDRIVSRLPDAAWSA